MNEEMSAWKGQTSEYTKPRKVLACVGIIANKIDTKGINPT